MTAPSSSNIDLTLVVPIYNALPYFRRCIDSIVGQDCGRYSMELLLVDDGSTDGSGAYCDEVAAEHDSVRVIHEENSGTPAHPRNVGIDNAQGEYLFFCDADDYFEDGAIVAMLDHASADGCDVGIFKMEGHGRKTPGVDLFLSSQKHCTIDNSAILNSLGPCKLYRTSLIQTHALKFPEGIAFEDLPFTLECYFLADDICLYSDRTYYHTVWRDDGASLSQGGSTAAVWGTLQARITGLTTYIDTCQRYRQLDKCPELYTRIVDLATDDMYLWAQTEPEHLPDIMQSVREVIQPLDRVELRSVLFLKKLINFDALLESTESFVEIERTWPDGPQVAFAEDGGRLCYSVYSDEDDRLLLKRQLPLVEGQQDQPLTDPHIFRNQITDVTADDERLTFTGHVHLLHRFDQGTITARLRTSFDNTEADRLFDDVETTVPSVRHAYASVYEIDFDWSCRCRFADWAPQQDAGRTRVDFLFDVEFDDGDVLSNRFGHDRLPEVFEAFMSRQTWAGGYLFIPQQSEFQNFSFAAFSQNYPFIKGARIGFGDKNDGTPALKVRASTRINKLVAAELSLVFLDHRGREALRLDLRERVQDGRPLYRRVFPIARLEKTLKNGTYRIELQAEIANGTVHSSDIREMDNAQQTCSSQKCLHSLSVSEDGAVTYAIRKG
ncbi:MAG: glycosyltransferase [Coriobacteriaceae bacterium]|nr:glycosyltransferase [Coriobacteriaceae bacterium]